MKKSTLILLKTLTWLACLYPAAMIVYHGVTNTFGPDPTRDITFSTGLAALRLLVLSLAITPLRKLWTGFNFLIRFRRLLGLFAFFYASLHLFAYIGLYSSFDPGAMVKDVVQRRFIAVGVLAWLCLVPLAITSTTGWIRRLGGKNWNRLHKLVYVSVCLGIVHYWWQVKPGVLTPTTVTVVMAILFIARPVLDWWNARKRKPRTA